MRGESFGVGRKPGSLPSRPSVERGGLARASSRSPPPPEPFIHAAATRSVSRPLDTEGPSARGCSGGAWFGAERAPLPPWRPRGSCSPAPARRPLPPPGSPPSPPAGASPALPGGLGLGARLPGAGGSHLLPARRGAGGHGAGRQRCHRGRRLPSPAASLLLRDAGAHSRLVRSTCEWGLSGDLREGRVLLRDGHHPPPHAHAFSSAN